MNSILEHDDPGNARCSGCGGAFTCGLRAGVPQCWCAQRPPLAPLPGRDCLCPSCLAEALARSEHVTR